MNQPNVQGLNQLMQMSNPINAIQNMPNGQMVLDMVKGKDPREVFMDECSKRGLDPNLIINQLQSIR